MNPQVAVVTSRVQCMCLFVCFPGPPEGGSVLWQVLGFHGCAAHATSLAHLGVLSSLHVRIVWSRGPSSLRFFFFSRLGSFVQHPHRHGNLAAALPALVFTPSVSGGNGRSRRLDCTSLSSAFHTRSRYWNEWDCLVRFVVIRRACSILYPLEFFPKMSHPHPSTPLHCYVTWWNDCYLIDDLFPCFYTVADKLFCTLPVEPSMHVPT